ncbi:hypothetical protein SAMN05216266_12249 [Amycolatopsis marina]|uniref:Right handed beta helix region n=1 Tax=Amycolatopsis marina TaxID=490629 RepID=A0A1I1C7Z5_9PSEU|nr:hypothetical protein [Amycolatopsis marina]SFB58537.1 hypothetical protein SAMN05216266_12249 [Amycolatopsis marina]
MSKVRCARSISLGALAAATAGLVLVAPPASAGLTTHCAGTAGAVTVPGDLLVPEGKSCVLDGTTVTGVVTVAEGANLIITGGAFEQGVTVLDDGFFDAELTGIGGGVRMIDAYGTYLADLTTGGGLRVEAPEHPERATYAYLSGATVGGDVSSRAGELYAEHSILRSGLSGAEVSYVDLYDVVLEGDLAVRDAQLGSVVCGSEVYGDAHFTDNSGTVQVGADGPVASCAAAGYWDGDVRIADNTAHVRVSGNIIRGDLSGTGNAPAPEVSGNRVRGEASGQFDTSSAARAEAMADNRAGQADRGAALAEQTRDRRSAAQAVAVAAGPVEL